jgi:hypothetical protein
MHTSGKNHLNLMGHVTKHNMEAIS